jgi:hypothetical protein
MRCKQDFGRTRASFAGLLPAHGHPHCTCCDSTVTQTQGGRKRQHATAANNAGTPVNAALDVASPKQGLCKDMCGGARDRTEQQT